MILGMENHLKYSVKIGPITVKEFDEVELLEIIIDKVLNSRTNIYNLSSTRYLRWEFLCITSTSGKKEHTARRSRTD